MSRYKFTRTGFVLDRDEEEYFRERLPDGTLPPDFPKYRANFYVQAHPEEYCDIPGPPTHHVNFHPTNTSTQTEVQESEDFEPKKLSEMENKPPDDDGDSNSKTDEDSPTTSSHDQSHSPNLQTSEEIQSCSTSSLNSNAACDCETDHSSSAIIEAKTSPNQDLKRSRRSSKRKRESEDHCPICSLTLRGAELESHFQKEVENLSNIARNIKSRRVSYRQREGYRCGINMAFMRVRTNREDRNDARREKYTNRHTVTCPVCKIRITGSDEEINNHVFDCFGEDEESDIDVTVTDHDGDFEEYEIGNETRIRAISLVPGGHRALHGYSSTRSRSTNDDEDDVAVLNVEDDDTSAFGEPQYTELDVIHNYPHTSTSSDKRENEELRKAVSDPSAKPHVIEGRKWTQNCEIQNEVDEIVRSCAKGKPPEDKSQESEGKDTEVEDAKEKENPQHTESNVISSLKKKIMELENQKNIKCLICLESYTRPVVSTTCWHVHCEECWLVSMGVKKLCPQCNMIVFPTDLRRIYI